jgi:hypothetical protein
MRNGGFWFKVKVLSFKKRFCNGDRDAQLTPATAYTQTLVAIAAGQSNGRLHTVRYLKPENPGLPKHFLARLATITALTTD